MDFQKNIVLNILKLACLVHDSDVLGLITLSSVVESSKGQDAVTVKRVLSGSRYH
jgi:hypothetical protein